MESKRFHISRCVTMALSALIILMSLCLAGFSFEALIRLPWASPLLGTNLLAYGAATLLAVGVAAIVLTPLGLYAVVLQHSSLLALFMLSCFALACISIVGGILGFCLQQEIAGGVLYEWMKDGLRSAYGQVENSELTHAWDRMQHELSCCGVEEGDEWTSANWFLGQVRHPRRRRPTACCLTCEQARERFCLSLADPPSISRPNSNNADLLVCSRVKERCGETSRRRDPFDYDICTGQRPPPAGMPMDAFVHSKGCLGLLEKRLVFHASQITLSGFASAVLLFANAAASFVLIYASEPLHEYDAVEAAFH